jgi:peptidyl-prolyl cis-trans isomerase A (cyclophilin A)
MGWVPPLIRRLVSLGRQRTALAAAAALIILCLVMLTTGCGNENPQVLLRTDLGDITIEVYSKQAPITAANFLRYVEEGRFREATFYRTVTLDNQPNNAVKIEVVQGGLKDDVDSLGLPPIPHETTAATGILHKNGTVSMARAEPGTASSEIFICIGDQPELDFGGRRNPDGQGFAAFGKVISGMDVVRTIHSQPADGQSLTPAIPIKEVELLGR